MPTTAGRAGPEVLYTHTVPPAAAWSLPLARGRSVLLTAAAGANLAMLVLGPDRLDRLSVADTLTAQGRACVAPPMVLMSDRGLALLSVTGSSLPSHDALCGMGADRHVPGAATSFQRDRNDWRRSARTLVLSELAKHGLGELDLHAPVSFFSRVCVQEDAAGSLAYLPGYCRDGDWVSLRAEQDVLLVLCTAPHPLDPQWAPAAVHARVLAAGPAAPLGEDASYRLCPQSARALEQSLRASG